MHKLGDDKTIRMAMLFAVTFALGNVAVLSLPPLLEMSPRSSHYWLLQLEVVAPLQFPWKTIGTIALDPLRQMGVWLALVFLTFLISITRNAFLAGLLNAAVAAVSGASIYAIAWKMPLSDNATVIAVLLLLILSQVFIAALRGFAAVTRSYLNAARDGISTVRAV